MWPIEGMHPWWMGFGMVIWVALLVLLIWAITRVAAHEQPGRTDDTPEQILKRRYARGEIDREQYEQRLSDLRK
jgi:putative membrane protein